MSAIVREDSPFGAVPVTDGGVVLCLGCAAGGACRIGLTAQRVDPNGDTDVELACPRTFEGGPGVAFGGWISMAFDHTLGAIPMWLGMGGLTVNLSVDFLAPVPVEVPVTIRGRVVSHEGKRWELAAELLLPDGRTAARARALLLDPSPTHFDAYRTQP